VGISVTIIDDSDYVGFAASAMRIGELYMTSVDDMVKQVLDHLDSWRPNVGGDVLAYAHSHGRVPIPALPAKGSVKMSRLNILDHGNAKGLQIGNDRVRVDTFSKFEPTLARLAPRFDTDAFAHLQHCDAAQNLRLMELFADAFGVPVVAGRGVTNPVLRFNTGNFARVYPGGRGGTRKQNDTFFWGPSGQ
jgi:hypothetical protein